MAGEAETVKISPTNGSFNGSEPMEHSADGCWDIKAGGEHHGKAADITERGNL